MNDVDPPAPATAGRRRARRAGLVVAGLLLLAGLPITLARLTGWTASPSVVLMSFAPFALLPYLAATVLLVVLLVRRRGRLVAVGAGAAVLLLLVHVWWVAPLFVGSAPQPAAGAERVVVMSANVQFGSGDAAFVVDEVRERGVDVLVVSEITPTFLAAADEAGLDELLPHRLGRAADRAAGTIVFTNEPASEVAAVETAFVSLVVRTHDLTLLATHPAPPQSSGHWRREQPLLLEAAREHDVDAVVGDLNATLDHPVIRDLVGSGWRDAVELTNGGFAPTWPENGEHGFPFPVVQIDHVLARDSVAVVDVDSFAVPDTDHHAVVATLAATAP
ncbi:endonuclease/exonuclease/phosphatase family protein [Nocardioides sp. C4-1]|uniref:endonuclease/exonuclease/phosphatase family protein n=1 Tax=Nocardioides sp. C4-1 TaxID=3151851 RepID=UPI003264C4B8